MSESREAVPEPKRRSTKAIVIGLAVVALILAADLYTKSWALENLSGRILNQPDRVCQIDRFGRIENRRAATRPYVIIPDFFELRYAENCGAAFGFMNRWSPLAKKLVFFPVALGAVLFLGFMFVTGRGGRLLASAVPLIIAGALGNFHDRLVHGYVVDFIRFYGETPEWMQFDVRILWLRLSLGATWEYPTFNVADIAITLGVAFLLFDGFTENRRLARQEGTTTGGGYGSIGQGERGPAAREEAFPSSALHEDEIAEGASAPEGTGDPKERAAIDHPMDDSSANDGDPPGPSEGIEEERRAHTGPSHGYRPRREPEEGVSSGGSRPAAGSSPATRATPTESGQARAAGEHITAESPPVDQSEPPARASKSPSESPPQSERGRKPTAGA